MLHAPINETKAESRQNKRTSARLHERYPWSVDVLRPGSMKTGDGPPVGSIAGRPRSALGTLQCAYSNQAILRMQSGEWQGLQLTPLRPSQSGLLQRKCAGGGPAGSMGGCAGCREKRELSLQRRATEQGKPDTVPPIMHDVLHSPGQPLDPETREFMEPHFRHDFSHVRVHTDAKAAESARAVNALAYTVGRDVVFGAGEYKPTTNEGKRLIAHELTHVIQQRMGAMDRLEHPVLAGEDSGAEFEAQANASAVVGNQVSWDLSNDHRFPTVRPFTPGSTLLKGTVQKNDVSTTKRRPLTTPERKAAQFVFRKSLDLDKIILQEDPVMTAGLHGKHYARTLPRVIYFPPGELDHLDIAWLIHELTHSWQYQHDLANLDILIDAIRGHYDYGNEAGLIAARAAGKKFTDFNTEQQGDILRDYYLRWNAGLNVAAWQPYVAEVQQIGEIRPTRGGERYPVPRWDQLPQDAQKDLDSRDYDETWFREHDDRPEIRLTVLNLYVKLKGLNLWEFVDTQNNTKLGVMQFLCSRIDGFKDTLRKRDDFTSPEESLEEWSSREMRAMAQLHFKHFKGWPITLVEAHIDQAGLLLRSKWWWLFPPIPLLQMAGHGLSYESYMDVYGIRRILLDQGWYSAPLRGVTAPAHSS